MYTCRSCRRQHTDLEDLVSIGTQEFNGDIWYYYNCSCKSTVLIHEEINKELEESTKKRWAEEEEKHYQEHINWGKM